MDSNLQKEIDRRQNEAWCISLLKLISPSERAMVSKCLDMNSRVTSERCKKEIEKIINDFPT